MASFCKKDAHLLGEERIATCLREEQCCSFGAYVLPEMTSQEEAEMLKDQAKAMQEDINSINERIKELESTKKSEKK